MSERVIALTLVSAGTGLPELATAVVAGIRRHSAVAVGNVVGSNIFNVFGILGTVALASSPVVVSDLIGGRTCGGCWRFRGSPWWLRSSQALGRYRPVSMLIGLGSLAAYVVYLTTLL